MEKVLSSDCGLSNTNKQTQLHMLNNCPKLYVMVDIHDVTTLFCLRSVIIKPRWKILDSNYLLIWPVLKIRKFCLMVLDLILWWKAVEVSFLGFLPKNIQEFRNFCKQYDCINVMRMMEKLYEVAARSSYFIYTRR